jgi:hypothetical protein
MLRRRWCSLRAGDHPFRAPAYAALRRAASPDDRPMPASGRILIAELMERRDSGRESMAARPRVTTRVEDANSYQGSPRREASRRADRPRRNHRRSASTRSSAAGQSSPTRFAAPVSRGSLSPRARTPGGIRQTCRRNLTILRRPPDVQLFGICVDPLASGTTRDAVGHERERPGSMIRGVCLRRHTLG